MTERDLRPIAAVIDWNNQRRMWACRKAAALVKLRYFAGMSLREAADALGIARSTAVLHWTYAKSYLYCELEDGSEN
jgi:hypothetical protein